MTYAAMRYQFIIKLIGVYSMKVSYLKDRVTFDCAWQFDCLECSRMMECEMLFEDYLPYLDLEQAERLKEKHPEVFV